MLMMFVDLGHCVAELSGKSWPKCDAIRQHMAGFGPLGGQFGKDLVNIGRRLPIRARCWPNLAPTSPQPPESTNVGQQWSYFLPVLADIGPIRPDFPNFSRTHAPGATFEQLSDMG